jgi:hypothetical protein
MTVVVPQLAQGGGDGWNSGGDGWNSSDMKVGLPEFQAGAQPVSLPPTPSAGPLPVMNQI